MSNTKRIVILGAGYGGVHAAKLLNKRFKKNEQIEITLIDRNTFHTLLTELHEVAGSRVEPDSVQIDLKKIFNATKVNLVTDNITKIDFKAQKLFSDSAEYSYDYLILGTGSEPAFFGVPGCRENAFTLWSFEDAMKIREHIETVFRKARVEKNLQKRREMLTFIVAGAGFTGIEMIGELLEWKEKLCRENYIDESEVRLMVVEAVGNILTMLGENMRAKAERYLRKKGVEILTNAPIVKVDKDGITLKDGTEIKTHTLIWTCGVQGNEVAAKFGLTMGKRNRIQANEFMQSVDYSNVYLIGDNAYFEEEPNKGIPQIVETALQTAETAVHNIVADIEGKEKKPFKSNYHGFMVSIGGRYGVAEVAGMKLTGIFAMAMKHLVNLHYLFGVGGINVCWGYLKHEFFDMRENRSFLGGHLGAKTNTWWLVLLRIFVGVMWLTEGIKKIQEGWLVPGSNKLNFMFTATQATTGASQAAEATTGASQAAAGGAGAVASQVPLLAHPPAIYQWFLDTFIQPVSGIFQYVVVFIEIGIGLALIAGLFTFVASVVSIGMNLNFILSAMAGKESLWYIFASIALMGGAGRAFGLDYYVMPWLKRWWNKTNFARKTYLYVDKPNIRF
ncbi:FAD-dependent oxidoreductase [Fonticella tunisiensis]|uniref:NADH:ubiquinone reductase (non-electrogenic) n=1 Tax=Fonticella tunisiensis TaxID=1096341 RepID=A0A4V3ETB8_9CLOT|nr:FAD-dependent oxidoreductase [Fonticella tunisiensis]TDT60997.1 NADH dehydrogenase [Fonticella tunisiensis]